jgi:hypothetical protein
MGSTTLPVERCPETRNLDGARPRCARGARWVANAVGAAIALAPALAGAEPFPSNDFAIDLFQGPILAPIRVTGISGAYAGYAEGIEGMVSNAAAPAVREPFSVNWLEVDAAASISIPLNLFENNDFDNSNAIDSDFSNFIYLTGGVLLQAGMFGLGANAELQRYTITGSTGGETSVTVGKYHVLAGIRLLGDQLMIGAGPRAVTLGLNAPEANLTFAGLAPEVGVLVRPDWHSFRIGATYRMPVTASGVLGEADTVDASGRRLAGGLVLPDNVVLPWEVEAGVAIQVGPRPLNPEWIDPHAQEAELEADFERRRLAREHARERQIAREPDPVLRAKLARDLAVEEKRRAADEGRRLEASRARLKRERRARYWNWPRPHLLFTAEVLITGPVSRAVTLSQFLGQNEPSDACRDVPLDERPACEQKQAQPGNAGSAVNYAPRFGIETEPVPGLIKTRFGSYYEPNRLDDGRVGRQHFTFGADLRAFTTTWWGLVPEVIYKVQSSFDLAPRYQSFSAGIGVWH